ncbi:hypothetical protein C8J56DRAFT_1055490 [Mycena floridula]|nr:hypothetical protein C8J56DRAFT_1055490 [Mycena floridula]
MARLSKITTPPGVEPIGYDAVEQKFFMVPVEGIELPFGIPIVGHINGDLTCSITITFRALKKAERIKDGSRTESMLSIVQQLTQLVVPLCTSKLEWDVWEFQAEHHVITFGGLEPGFTGLQMNLLSSRNGGNLTLSRS